MHGNHPFGAILVDESNVVLLEVENTVNTAHDCTGHAETNWFGKPHNGCARNIEKCTLYTSTEPCAMCAGAIHWGQIGRVVFALSEEQLYAKIGSHAENETITLPAAGVARSTARLRLLAHSLKKLGRCMRDFGHSWRNWGSNKCHHPPATGYQPNLRQPSRLRPPATGR
ncbi:MAG: nucleoside deaminase [Anaerolineae bacterium]